MEGISNKIFFEYLNLCDFNTGVKELEDILKSEEQIKNYINLYLKIKKCELYFFIYQKEPYTELLNELNKSIRKTHSKIIKGMIFKEFGLNYLWVGDNKNATIYMNKALSEFKLLCNYKRVSIIYSYLSQIYTRTQNPVLVRNFVRKALRIREKLNDKKGIAMSYNTLAYTYERQMNFKMARRYYELSLKIRHSLGNLYYLSVGLLNLGNLYQQMGLIEDAIELLYKATSNFEKMGYTRILAKSYVNIGISYFKISKYFKAIIFLTLAFHNAKKINDRITLIEIYKFVAKICAIFNLPKLSFEFFECSIQLARNSNDNRKIIDIVLLIVQNRLFNLDFKNVKRNFMEIKKLASNYNLKYILDELNFYKYIYFLLKRESQHKKIFKFPFKLQKQQQLTLEIIDKINSKRFEDASKLIRKFKVLCIKFKAEFTYFKYLHFFVKLFKKYNEHKIIKNLENEFNDFKIHSHFQQIQTNLNKFK